MARYVITGKTDSFGRYTSAIEVDPKLLFDMKVDIFAALLSPPNLKFVGTLDIDAVDGSVQSDPRSFQIATGERVLLGRWKIDKKKNSIKVDGATVPPSPETALTVEITATL